MATTLAGIPSDVIQAHILPRLDGPSLSATATLSSHLQHLCSVDTLWADVTKSTWPSITHPRVHDVISTFPAGHRSFFHDSFPALFTDIHRRRSEQPPSTAVAPPELISAVDIRYQNDLVYSAVQFSDTSPDFLSSELRMEFTDDPTCNQFGSGSRSGSEQDHIVSRSIDLKVDDLAGADEATLSHLKESVTLSWILIDPTRKRAGNLSSIKPVSVRQDWVGNKTVLRFVTVLPGPDPDEMVQCKIRMVLGVNRTGPVGLHVKHVVLELQDLYYRLLSGREFLVITQGAILEENIVRRKVMDYEERWMSHQEFKQMKRDKKEFEKREEEKRELAIKINLVVILVSFFLSIYFLILLLQ